MKLSGFSLRYTQSALRIHSRRVSIVGSCGRQSHFDNLHIIQNMSRSHYPHTMCGKVKKQDYEGNDKQRGTEGQRGTTGRGGRDL